MASSCHRCARRVKISLLFAGMRRWPPVSAPAHPRVHFFFLAFSRLGKALRNITDFHHFVAFVAINDVFSSHFVFPIVLRTVWCTKIIFSRCLRPKTRKMRNLADMPRATRHEATSPGRAIRPKLSSKRRRRLLVRSIKRPHQAWISPRLSRLLLRRRKRLTPVLRPRQCKIRRFRRMIARAPPPRMRPSVRWGLARTHNASGIALRCAILTTVERSG